MSFVRQKVATRLNMTCPRGEGFSAGKLVEYAEIMTQERTSEEVLDEPLGKELKWSVWEG